MSALRTAGVGATLRMFRKRMRLSQSEFAERLQVTQPTVSAYERGRSQIDADDLPTFARLLGVQPGAFYGEEEQPLSVTALLRRLEEALRGQDQPVKEHAPMTTTDRREDVAYFFAICEEQDIENARLTAEGFTGAARDLTTGDVAAWVQGKRLGWRSTTADAEALVRDQLVRDTTRGA